MVSRRVFLKYTGATAMTLFAFDQFGIPKALAQIPGGSLDPNGVTKYVTPLLIPPVMPKAGIVMQKGRAIDYYEISMRQFAQQILPAPLPPTTVWGYGAVK
ncbi:MAG TPA: bilirubin oxidase, partial [Candidatus Methylomirabilis sp.]|nr:bilirubin oxidase [Candidatus Methylomirabilis sp.]